VGAGTGTGEHYPSVRTRCHLDQEDREKELVYTAHKLEEAELLGALSNEPLVIGSIAVAKAIIWPSKVNL
jgi:hypothetical protein